MDQVPTEPPYCSILTNLMKTAKYITLFEFCKVYWSTIITYLHYLQTYFEGPKMYCPKTIVKIKFGLNCPKKRLGYFWDFWPLIFLLSCFFWFLIFFFPVIYTFRPYLLVQFLSSGIGRLHRGRGHQPYHSRLVSFDQWRRLHPRA